MRKKKKILKFKVKVEFIYDSHGQTVSLHPVYLQIFTIRDA